LETEYDELLASGHDRDDARTVVKDKVAEIMDRWKGI
jgi:hypothetical protein